MKALPFPTADDEAALTAIAGRKPVRGSHYLKEDLQLVRERYIAYHAAQGNALNPNAPQPIIMRSRLQNALLSRYETCSEAREFIEIIRHQVSPDICPMCGGAFPGTIDHVFPRHPFKELAIFSKNLVPACSNCNSPRKNAYKGAGAGERVLHPYYDVRMNERLVRASISPCNGSYDKPIIGVEVCLQGGDPLYPAAKFHLDYIILPSGVVNVLDKMWSNLQRDKNGVLQLVGSVFSDADFDQEVSAALARADAEFDSRNSWKSMLLAGLDVTVDAKRALAGIIRDLRAGRKTVGDL